MLAIYLYKDYIMCCCSSWPSTLLEGVQSGEQQWGALCSGEKLAEQLQIIRCSQEPIVWAQSLYLPISRKALKSFMVTLLLVTRKGFMRLIETFWKICAWLHVLPLHKKSHLYWPPSTRPPTTTSLKQFFRVIWGAVSQAAILILPQIKFNLQLSHCAMFFFLNVNCGLC